MCTNNKITLKHETASSAKGKHPCGYTTAFTQELSILVDYLIFFTLDLIITNEQVT